jgi:hypothetical protein
VELRTTLLGRGMERRLARRVAALHLLPAGDSRPVTDADLAPLPAPAQRWLRASGVVGRPRDRSFRMRTTGSFRLRPGTRWMPYEAWQYDAVVGAAGPGGGAPGVGTAAVARVYCMRIDLAGVLPVHGVDSYVAGAGRMRGRLLGLVPVADGSGPEFDVSELVTWVAEAAMTAPSMLLVPAVRWTAVDDTAVDVSVSDSGTVATARLTVDAAGRLVEVGTEDRWAALPGGPVRARWTTTVEGRLEAGGRSLPAGGVAVWHLPDGEYPYGRVRVDPRFLAWDVVPRG